MPGKHKRSNPFLLLIAILMCLSPCLLFTQSAADQARINGEISAEDPFAPEPSEDSGSVTDNSKDNSTPSATPTTAPVKPKASKEAATGIWTPSGSDWLFMVDGRPYTGCLLILTASIIILTVTASCKPDGWKIRTNVIIWIWTVSCRPETKLLTVKNIILQKMDLWKNKLFSFLLLTEKDTGNNSCVFCFL